MSTQAVQDFLSTVGQDDAIQVELQRVLEAE